MAGRAIIRCESPFSFGSDAASLAAWQAMSVRWVFWLAVAFNVLVALMPMTFETPRLAHNRLDPQSDGTLLFREPSMARSPTAPPWIGDASRSGRIEVDMRVTPARTKQTGPARILAVSEDYASHNLMIGQEEDALLIRLRRPGAEPDGQPALTVPGVFEAGQPVDIVVSVEPGLLRLAVDRRTTLRRSLPPDALVAWHPAYRVALGNEVIGMRGWDGAIERAIVTTPHFRDDLLAPGRLLAPQSWWEVPYRLQDLTHFELPLDGWIAVLHILAFAPIGYAAARMSPGKRRPGMAVVAIAMLAVAVEALKIAVAGRHPTLLNVLANFSGGLIGVALSQYLRNWSGFVGRLRMLFSGHEGTR